MNEAGLGQVDALEHGFGVAVSLENDTHFRNETCGYFIQSGAVEEEVAAAAQAFDIGVGSTEMLTPVSRMLTPVSRMLPFRDKGPLVAMP